MTRRILPAVLGVLLAAVVGIVAWARVPIPTIEAGSMSPPILSTLGPSPTSSATASPSPTLAPAAGLPGYPGVLVTPWPGPATWGYQGEITSGPPMYPQPDTPAAATSCPWSAADAYWAQAAMIVDASDDLETYNILVSGEGFQYGWDESQGSQALYQRVSGEWGQIAGWINALCFPVAGGAANQPPSSADVASAITWLEAGAASHPGSDAWDESWRDAYQYVTAMFEEIG